MEGVDRVRLGEFRETRRSRAAFFCLPHWAADRTAYAHRGAHACHRHTLLRPSARDLLYSLALVFTFNFHLSSV